MKLNNFSQALRYLYQQIPPGTKQRFPGYLGLERTKHFLRLLGNPQDKLRIIHIAGTSGKGSTVCLASLLLKNLGFRVGLHVSPHLVDIRERCQINNQLISEKKFCHYLNQLMPAINQLTNSTMGKPTYFEILVVLAYLIFYLEKVNYAVIETGMGGLYDGTNTVTSKNKLVVLTKIGLDHTSILGKTLSKIAWQKAMIIQNNNQVISLWQKPSVRKTIEKIVKEKQAKLFYLKKGVNYSNIQSTIKKTGFNFQFLNNKFDHLCLGLVGSYQVENCSLALAAVIILGRKNIFTVDENIVRKTLKQVDYPGRFEIIKTKNKTLIIDGAHNPQKMSSFTSNLKNFFTEQKLNFLVAFKQGKDFRKMLQYIVPLANEIIVASFFVDNQDLVHLSEKPQNVTKVLDRLNFKNYQIIDNPKEAFKKLLVSSEKYLVVTGSLYLISSLYPLFPPAIDKRSN